MSQIVAVSTLQERVRVLCGLPAFSTTSAVRTSDILDFLQASCAMLGGIVKERAGENYLGASGTLMTQADVPWVSLPTQCSDVLRLSWQKSASEEIPLERATVDELQAYPNRWSGDQTPRYALVGNTIELFPTPDAAYTLRIYYTTGIYVTSTSDQFVCRDWWDQWIVMQACRFVRATQQKDGAEFIGMQAEAESKIRSQLKRDHFGVRRVRDLRGTPYGDTVTSRVPWRE
jgi:hypothetical protein